MENLLNNAEITTQKALSHLQKVLAKFNANKVHPDMLKNISIDYHGIDSPLEQLATIKISNNSTLTIKPWEKKLTVAIQKAILKNNEHDFNIKSDGEIVYATRPSLTEESRTKIVKQVDKKAEESKVVIRNIRKTIKDKIKQATKSEDEIKRAENELQKLINSTIKKIEALQEAKKKEIMKI